MNKLCDILGPRRMKGLLALLFILCLSCVRAQEPPVRHFIPSTGGVFATYRDFATSPLFYRGPGVQLGLGNLWETARAEYTFETIINAAMTSSQPPESGYFGTRNLGWLVNFNLYGHYLRKLPASPHERLSFAAGGALTSDFNVRINESLGNAAGGLEALVSLQAVGKASWDASRRQADTLNLKLFKVARKAVSRKIDFRLNAGMLNLNYRPGYAYVYDGELEGGQPGLDWVLSDHRWKANGWRLGTAFGITRHRPNAHAYRVEYRWDAVHAPGQFEAFQMALHTLKLVYMFTTTRHRE